MRAEKVRLASSVAIALALMVATGEASAARKTKRTAVAPPPQPACARAAYPGDPVCDAGSDHGALPLPASRLIRRHDDSAGFLVGEGVSVDGKTNFNENRFGAAPLHKFTPRPPAKSQTNGGAQVDFRF